jgi:hypothetical protein
LEIAFEKAADDFVALGHEDALGGMFCGAAEGAVGREFGEVEGGNFVEVEHGST